MQHQNLIPKISTRRGTDGKITLTVGERVEVGISAETWSALLADWTKEQSQWLKTLSKNGS